MSPVLLLHCRQREQIGLDCQRVAIGDPGKAGVWKHRKIIRPLGADTLAQCAQKLGVGPSADAGCRIGSDVWRVEGAEWCRERSAAGELRSPGDSMAREAAAGPHQILSALESIFLACC